MEIPEDRIELNNEIQKFAQRKLKKVETKVKTGTGDVVIEKRTAKGITTGDAKNVKNETAQAINRKLDLQVGYVSEGLMIGSNDVATCMKTLQDYGITHILNLAPNETQPFQYEDDFNHLSVQIDENTNRLKDVLEKCFDFIEEGQQKGMCFVHCSTAKPGLSRSTSVCVAYLIYKNKKSYAEALEDVKNARAFVRPSDSFAKQLQEYATEQGAKQQEVPGEDKFTARKRKETEAEVASLAKVVNLQKKKNLFDKQAEETQRKQLDEQLQHQKRMENKMRNNAAFSSNQPLNNKNFNQPESGGSRKLTSLMTLFQQKENEPAKPVNKIVLNSAPVKKWAPVSTPHLQRTVKPETKNYDFYSKVKRTKSKDFKRTESLRKSKSKLNNDLDINNNQPKAEVKQPNNQPPIPPPPPPLPMLSAKIEPVKQAVNKPTTINNKSTINNKPIAIPPPPPPPPPMLQPIKSTNTVTPETPSQSKPAPKFGLQHNTPIKTPSPIQSINSSRTSSPQPPSSNTSSRVSSPQPNTLIKPLTSNIQPNKTMTNVQPLKNLDKDRLKKFNQANEANSWINDKCIDYSGKINAPKTPVEVVRNIPIKIEPSSTNKSNTISPASNNEKKEVKEEIVELEIEESSEESEEEESEEEESEEESEESSEEESEESEEEESEESSEEESESEESEEEVVTLTKPKTGGLSRSATQEILRMIKSKNDDINSLNAITEEDEDREIDLLLSGLEREGVENIDWSEFELSLDDIQDIIKNN